MDAEKLLNGYSGGCQVERTKTKFLKVFGTYNQQIYVFKSKITDG